jgi:hypothetical protein
VIGVYVGVLSTIIGVGSVGLGLWQINKSVDDVEDLLREVERRSRPIEQFTLEAAFRIPLDDHTLEENPELKQYKERLDREFWALFKAYSGSPESFPNRSAVGRDPRIVRDGDVIDRFWLSTEHDLFPANAGPSVRNLVSINLLEVAFYRDPIEPPDFVLSRLGLFSTAAPLPERREPDFGVEAIPESSKWRLSARFGKERDYQLEIRGWRPNGSQWRQNGSRLAFEQDLAGSQLIIDFGGNTPRLAAVRAAFELAGVTLYVNERPITIPIEEVVKHTVQDADSNQHGQPFWEYRFPDDVDIIFFRPPNRGVRPRISIGRQ